LPGGEACFRATHAAAAAKIDADVAIPAAARRQAWNEIEAWNGTTAIEDLAYKAFFRLQFQGPAVALVPTECVGTAQPRSSLEQAFARQKPPRLPALTLIEARTYLSDVESEADSAAALALFKRHFQHLRLRSIRPGKTRARIFAFRNPASRSEPLGNGPLVDIFVRLAIPGTNPADCTMFGFKPANDDLVHQPTCFDANMRNLDDFIPGGVTAGGMDEVIATPPRTQNVTHAPRRIT
jgi:hypothetical protein